MHFLSPDTYIPACLPIKQVLGLNLKNAPNKLPEKSGSNFWAQRFSDCPYYINLVIDALINF